MNSIQLPIEIIYKISKYLKYDDVCILRNIFLSYDKQLYKLYMKRLHKNIFYNVIKQLDENGDTKFMDNFQSDLFRYELFKDKTINIKLSYNNDKFMKRIENMISHLRRINIKNDTQFVIIENIHLDIKNKTIIQNSFCGPYIHKYIDHGSYTCYFCKRRYERQYLHSKFNNEINIGKGIKYIDDLYNCIYIINKTLFENFDDYKDLICCNCINKFLENGFLIKNSKFNKFFLCY